MKFDPTTGEVIDNIDPFNGRKYSNEFVQQLLDQNEDLQRDLTKYRLVIEEIKKMLVKEGIDITELENI